MTTEINQSMSRYAGRQHSAAYIETSYKLKITEIAKPTRPQAKLSKMAAANCLQRQGQHHDLSLVPVELIMM